MITLNLPPEIERHLMARAEKKGSDVSTEACDLIQRGLKAEPTLDEILEPFRLQVSQSGMTEEELDGLFEEVRNEVHQAKQKGQP